MIRLSPLALAGLLAGTETRAGAQCPSSGQRAAVAALSLAYTASASEGARISIRDSLYEEPFGIRSGIPVSRIFGVAYTIGQLGEPLALRTLAHPRSSGAQRLRIVVGNIVLPAAMGILAYRACR